MKTVLYSGLVSLLLAVPASAAPKAVFFSLERGKTEVKGTLVVDGYSPNEVRSFIRQYCKGGKVGEITPTGKPRKKRGNVLQKFATTCAGGPQDRFRGKRSSYEVEFITKDGQYKNKHLVEITTSDGKGNIVYLRETVRP